MARQVLEAPSAEKELAMTDGVRKDLFWRAVLVLGFLGAVGYLLSRPRSEFPNVDIAIGLKVLAFLAAWGIVQLGIYRVGISARWLFAVAVGSLSLCFWPAVDYWAEQQAPMPLLLSLDMEPDVSSIWWAAWYARVAVVGLLGAVGYCVGKWCGDR